MSGTRTLFIEIDQVNHRRIASEPAPFSHAIKIAQEQGWRVVYLDSNAIAKIHRRALTALHMAERQHQNTGARAHAVEKRRAEELMYYVNANLRERYWARVIAAHHAGPQDIVILHPIHVQGFLREIGHPNTPVREFKLQMKLKPVGYHKLTAKEVERFKRRRVNERKKRALSLPRKRA